MSAAVTTSAISSETPTAGEAALARISIRAIVEATAAHYGFSRVELLAHRRAQAVVRPRQVAMYLARRLTVCSLPEIGRRMGGRDHTTVMHGVARVEQRLATEPETAEEVTTIAGVLTAAAQAAAAAGTHLVADEDVVRIARMVLADERGASAATYDDVRSLASVVLARLAPLVEVDTALPVPTLPVVPSGPPTAPRGLPIHALAWPDRLRVPAAAVVVAWRVCETATYSRGEAAALRQLSRAIAGLGAALDATTPTTSTTRHAQEKNR